MAPSPLTAGGPLSVPDALIIIPARMQATRLPGKPLLSLHGLPMIVRTLRRAQGARCAARVVVATDDERIAAVVREHGGEACMTRPDHPSGTDRVAEAVAILRWEGLVINVQGDEPLIEPETIDRLAAALAQDVGAGVATVIAPLLGDAEVSSVVKVVADARGRAIYFSRRAIPDGGPFWHHVGLYGFRPEALAWFASQPPGRLEQAERLEQLRFIEGGWAMRLISVEQASPSVDTLDDLEQVRRLLASHSEEDDA
jgi:3-deoxy-manno-octulosonate cytidylyltransferase (CMP-KDO synthetase)